MTTAKIDISRLIVVSICLFTMLCAASASGQTTIFGVVSANGTISSGSGFTVKFIPAGTGATLYGQIRFVQHTPPTIVCQDSACQGNYSSLFVGEWILVSGVFYQIAQLNSPGFIVLTQNYTGPSTASMMSGNMTIWNSYAVTFTTPFVNPPAVMMSAKGWPSKGNGQGAGTAPVTIQFDKSGANKGLSNTGFQVFDQPTGSGGPTLPGASFSWTFVAVGS